MIYPMVMGMAEVMDDIRVALDLLPNLRRMIDAVISIWISFIRVFKI